MGWVDEEQTFEIGSDWNQNFADASQVRELVLQKSLDAFGVGFIADLASSFPLLSGYLDDLRNADGVTQVGEVLEALADFIRGMASLFEQIRDAVVGGVDPDDLEDNLREVYDYLRVEVEGGLAGLQTTLNQIRDLFNGLVVTPVNTTVQSVKGWLADLLGWKNTTTEDQEAIRAGIINGWEGTTTTGTDVAVYGTLAAIRALVGGDGYTRVNITSTTTWTKPVGTTEVIVIGISSGSSGSNGGNGGYLQPAGNGGAGGVGGGFMAQALDPSAFSALHVTIGAPLVVRANTSGGATLLEVQQGAPGAMATAFGYSASNSSAGGGGGGGAGSGSPNGQGGVGGSPNGTAGGNGSGSPGNGGQGGASVAAAGGAANGGAGISPSSQVIPCGGSGGGGGKGAAAASSNAQAGGAGGFPGGGGGGGGGGAAGSFNTSGAAGGAGGAGLGIIYYR